MPIKIMSAATLSIYLKRKLLLSSEITAMLLAHIERSDKSLGAYITVTADAARKKAGEIDKAREAGENLGKLAGIPFALKDNIMTKGIRTTCASRMLENFVPVYDAAVYGKLSAGGGVLLGKTNMDEFAMGSTTANSYFKKTKNPYDTSRVPGGSSGGAAAAVAEGMAVYALGSDTGGSVRQPAAFCGCVGMKPTYGRVSRYGLIAFASSLDQIGPITRDVYDNALVLSSICGKDERDATSVGESEDFTAGIDSGVKGLRIGIPDEFFAGNVEKGVSDRVMSAARELEKLGAELVRVRFSSLEYALPAYYVISSAEASSNLARFDGVRFGHRAKEFSDIDELYSKSRSEGFGDEVKRRIMLGTFALSAGYYNEYYKKAVAAKMLVNGDFAAAFEVCDLILTPTTPTVAYRFDERRDPVSEYIGDIFTVPASLAGLPAMSVPFGKVNGLPVGVQLIGKKFDEKTLYRVGCALEKAGEELE